MPYGMTTRTGSVSSTPSQYAAPRPRRPVARTSSGARRTTEAEKAMYREDGAGRMGLYLAGGYAPGGWQNAGASRNPLDEFAQVPVPLRTPGGGGGGGGGSAGPSASEIQAYKDLLASYDNSAVMSEFDRQDAANRAAYDPSRINARWDAQGAEANARWDGAGTATQGASAAGSDRLAGILAELQSKAAGARTAVSGAYGEGDARLQEIQGRFQGRQQVGVDQGNSILAAFGAGPVAASPEAAALQRLFAQGQITNNGARTVADAAQAGLPGAYAGLGADVSQGMTRDSTALLQQIAARRAADATRISAGRSGELQANDLALNQMLGQTGLARIQAQQQALQQETQLRIEMAKLGIEV